MVRTFLVAALIALLLSYVAAITVGIFTTPTMLVFALAALLLFLGAWLPTERPLAPVPPPSEPAASTPCPVCGRPLRWISEFERWWCETERKYR